METMTVTRKCALLAEDKTLRHLFELTMQNAEFTAALWAEGDTDACYTFSDYAVLCDAYAAYLRARVPEGGFIAIALDTCKEWLPTFWGVIRSGHDALLLDASLSDEALLTLMNEAGCETLISGREREWDVATVIPARELFAAPRVDDYSPVYADSVALCTSGTTGQSRVFVYNGAALCEQVLSSELLYNVNRRIVDNENRRSLVFLPFHHVLGFIVNLLWCGFIGYANIYLPDRTPASILSAAQRFQPHLLISVPLLANNLYTSLNRKVQKKGKASVIGFRVLTGLSLGLQTIAPRLGLHVASHVLFRGVLEQLLGTEMKCIILGGSHTPSESLKLLNALGYYTVCGFGMTETAVTSVETSMNLHKRVSGSVGTALKNVESDVTEAGELRLRGKSLHTGRMHDGKLLPPDLDAEGWIATGDIVRRERGGRLFIEGRLKEIIIGESGENVYPDELEDAFGTLPGAEQLCVLGVRSAQGPYEDIALVVRTHSDEGALLSRFKTINNHLPAYKRIRRVFLTEEAMPLVNGIKVKRQALKKALEAGTFPCHEAGAEQKAAANAQNAGEALIPQVRALYAAALELNEKDVGDDQHFIDDLGGDSLQMLSVALKAEEAFGLLIPVEEYGRCATVRQMAQLIHEKQTGEITHQDDAPVSPITRFEDSPEYQAFAKRQQALLAEGDNPYFVCHDSPLRDKSLMDGQEVLNFGSYNYVGMSGRPEVNEAAKAAIDLYGTSASGSRLLAGEKSLHGELEREIADWKHAESALVLVGGHSTNVTVVGNFCHKGDLIVYDALAHNSIEEGCKLSGAVAKPFPHNDAAALESILRVQRAKFAKVLIVIEGAYSMDGDVADVPAFVRLKKKYGCFLMVDEAHSACVIGETGGGVDEYFHLAPDDIDIKMGTLSKGLGACGGYLAGRACVIDYLRYNLPGFVFSVGLSPALAAASLEAIRQLRNDPSIMANLKRNIACFAEGARARGFDICLAGETAILPVLVGSDEDAFNLSNELRRRGVFAPPAVYPAVPKGKARLRFCVISEHTPEQIDHALTVLAQAAEDMGISLRHEETARALA